MATLNTGGSPGQGLPHGPYPTHMLPPTAGRRNERNWSALAKKYGHPYKWIRGLNDRVLKNTGKSGLTPISPFLKEGLYNTPMSQQDQKQRLYIYQKERYYSFTAAELHTIQVFSALDRQNYGRQNLKTGIHEMFAKSQWQTDKTLPKHIGFVPIFGGFDGHWEVSNLSYT